MSPQSSISIYNRNANRLRTPFITLHPLSGELNLDQCRYRNTTYRQHGAAVAIVAAA